MGSSTVASPSLQLTTPADTMYQLCHLNYDQLCILWHQHLGHLHSCCMSNLHKYAQGIPSDPIATQLDSCPICACAKLCHADQSMADSCHATMCNQGISVDFGFMVQCSTNGSYMKCLVGLNGETCYCLITDHYSRTHGNVSAMKLPPINFLKKTFLIDGLSFMVSWLMFLTSTFTWIGVVTWGIVRRLSNCFRMRATLLNPLPLLLSIRMAPVNALIRLLVMPCVPCLVVLPICLPSFGHTPSIIGLALHLPSLALFVQCYCPS